MRLCLLFFIVLFVSCSEDKNIHDVDSQKSIDSAATIDSIKSNVLAGVDEGDKIIGQTETYIGLEKFRDTLIYGQKWSAIELSGNPDTALALFAYRIIYTDNKDDSDDCLSLMNLIESTKTTKILMKRIFKSRASIYNFDKAVDSLNEASILHARDLEKDENENYGGSDGPCYELYLKTK